MSAPVILHARVVTGAGGGPDKTILNSPRFLRPHGYRTLCAYLYPPRDPEFGRLCRRADALDAPLIPVPDRGPLDLGVVERLLEVCRTENVTVWHAHDYKTNALGLLLRRFHPLRLVTTVHGWVKFTRRTPLYYWIDRRCLRHYERVLCVSPDLEAACLSAGVPADRCRLLENAIDIDQFRRRSTTEDAKRQLGFPADRLLIGAVGRLSAEKGFDRLIAAVARCVAEGHDVHLALVGDGDARPQLRKLIDEQPQPDRFDLLGFREDIDELYQAFDLFVSSSLREGLPNVLLEAMACEVPVVATRIAGIPRLIHDEDNGLLVPPEDADALATAIERLAADPDERRRLALAGRDTIERDYDFEARMAKVRAVYEELDVRPQPAPVS